MSDIFREVDEEYRREQMLGVAKRRAPLFVGAAVLLIVAAAGYTLWKRGEVSAQEAGTRLLQQAQIAATQQPAERQSLFDGVASKLKGDQAALARLKAAGARVEAGDEAGAVPLLQAVAGDGGVDPQLRETASLLAADAALDSGDPKQLQARLEPLLAADSPWRFLAEEADAALAARGGDTAKAAGLYEALAAEPDAPAGVKQRAADLAKFYKG